MSKIQFWKQFTTSLTRTISPQTLYSICQRYNFESNLQPNHSICGANLAVFDMSKIQFWKQFTTIKPYKATLQGCIRYVKDTILKAIYNYAHLIVSRFLAVFDMSKIQFWKQFTTVRKVLQGQRWLYSICQRYNFESNLQQKENMN